MASADIIRQGLDWLASAKNKSISDDRKDIYVALLGDLQDDLLIPAIKHCAATIIYFPEVSEIRAAAAEISKRIVHLPSPDEAWAELVHAQAPRQVRAYCKAYATLHDQQPEPGRYWHHINELKEHERTCTECRTVTIDPKFSHPVIREVAERLGWPDRFWSDEIGVDRGRFMRTYDETITRLTKDALLLPSVRNFIEREQQLLAEDRQSVFETGESLGLDQYKTTARRLTTNAG